MRRVLVSFEGGLGASGATARAQDHHPLHPHTQPPSTTPAVNRPDGLNSGGYQVVGDHGKRKWPYGQSTLCGDPVNDGKQLFMKPGPIQGE